MPGQDTKTVGVDVVPIDPSYLRFPSSYIGLACGTKGGARRQNIMVTYGVGHLAPIRSR